MIPLNQLIPECLLALGGAFLLGNLAAYIRLRPAWRDAKRARSGPAARRDANGTAKAARANARTGKPGRAGSTPRNPAARTPARPGPGETAAGRSGSVEAARGRGGSDEGPRERARSGGAKAAAGPGGGSSGRVTARVREPRVREPTTSGSSLPSRTRVLANVLIGLVISLAALATLIRG